MHNLLCTSFTALSLSLLCLACRQAPAPVPEPSKPLHELQQDFVDLRFGLFTHYGLPTYTTADWSDPDMSPEVMSAPGLDCGQWADAAVSAGMTFGCISVKIHRFKPVSAEKVRITITSATRKAPSIAELGVYQPL